MKKQMRLLDDVILQVIQPAEACHVTLSPDLGMVHTSYL